MLTAMTTILTGSVPLAAPPANGVHIVAASAGFLSFLLIWGAVMWGIFLRNGWASTRVRHSTLYSTHMGLGLMGLSLGLVHGAAQAAAPVTATSMVDVFVPFLNLDNPAWGDLPLLVRLGAGVGTISLELAIAATLATAVRQRLGQNRWRAAHMLNYAAYLLMVVHILVSGSDAGRPWAWGTVLGTTVITALTWAWTTRWATVARRRAERAVSISRPGTRLEIEVDAALCQRFGFCEHEAPAVFQLSGDGRLTYDASVPVEAADAVVRAARVCPARAIRLGQDATAIVTAPPPTPARGTGLNPPVPIDRASRKART